MSQQDNPQDSQDNVTEPESVSWATPPASNRPAEGATRVDSLAQAEPTWTAGDGATDFLGLEQDGGLGAPANSAGAAGTSEVNPTQAWLFHMEQERSGGGARTAAAPASGAAGVWSDDGLNPVPLAATAAPEIGDDESALQDPDLAVDVDGLEPALATQFSSGDAQPQGKKWLVAAGLATALLAAGGWQYWQSHSKSTGSDPVVWQGTNGKKPTRPAPGPTPKKPAGETPPVAAKPTPDKPLETPSTTAQSTPPVEQTPVEPTPVAQVEPQPAPAQPVAQAEPQPEPAPDFTPVPFTGSHPSDASSTLATPKGTRRPDAAEIAGLWTSAAIPFDAIGAESMLRTPSVGAVRVMLKNGEHFQGRLYSVGQGEVRMDIALGRMSVDYSDVSEIVQIMEADLTKKPANGMPEETAGLLYVTAKVPGGYITGWLVQRAEGKLTLITAEAKKVTVEDDGFEPVPKGGARVVGTIGRNASEAASPAPAPDTGIPKLQGGPAPVKTKTPNKPATPKPKSGKPTGPKSKN
jgi:hypothetical protein